MKYLISAITHFIKSSLLIQKIVKANNKFRLHGFVPYWVTIERGKMTISDADGEIIIEDHNEKYGKDKLERKPYKKDSGKAGFRNGRKDTSRSENKN